MESGLEIRMQITAYIMYVIVYMKIKKKTARNSFSYCIKLGDLQRFLPRDARSAKRGIATVSRPSVRM